jgi:hypothetical protein
VTSPFVAIDVVLVGEEDDNSVHMVRRANGVTMSAGPLNVTWVGDDDQLSRDRARLVLRRLLRELDEMERRR